MKIVAYPEDPVAVELPGDHGGSERAGRVDRAAIHWDEDQVDDENGHADRKRRQDLQISNGKNPDL